MSGSSARTFECQRFDGKLTICRDRCQATRGHNLCALAAGRCCQGRFTVALQRGAGDIARGEFMRWFAEVLYPTALLPSQGVRWEAVDDHSANATMVDSPLSLTLLFRFNDGGLIGSFRAEARGGMVGDKMVMAPGEAPGRTTRWFMACTCPTWAKRPGCGPRAANRTSSARSPRWLSSSRRDPRRLHRAPAAS